MSSAAVDTASADQPPATHNTRNPRRRQRKDVEDGGSLPRQPQRKRSKLIESARDSAGDNHTSASLDGLKETSSLALAEHRKSLSLSGLGSLSSVSQKRTSLRSKPEGSATLLENPRYSIQQLPSLPRQLRTTSLAFRGITHSWTSNILAITATQAIVWDSASTAPNPSTRVFELTNATRADEPPCFGALVNNGSALDLGLLIIHPTSGKITFWDNVENADSIKLFERGRAGVSGSIKGMYMTEKVIGLVELASVGFLVCFSSGRVAQTTIHDTQGKAEIQSRFLSKPSASAGFFDTIRNALTSTSSLKDCVGVHARPSTTRGVLEVAMASTEAVVQRWQLGWGRLPQFIREINLSKEISTALKNFYGADFTSGQQFELLDFAWFDAASLSDTDRMLLLVQSLGSRSNQTLVIECFVHGSDQQLVSTNGQESEPEITMQRPIPLQYNAVPADKSRIFSRPRLIKQVADDNALVVFSKALVLLSFPSHGLSSDSDASVFQDVVPLKKTEDFAPSIVGAAAIVPSTFSIVLESYGVLQVMFTRTSTSASGQPTKTPVHTRIEQAVFRNKLPNNPIDFSMSQFDAYSLEEISKAAVEVSDAIVSSTTKFLPPQTVSISEHLRARANALHDLAEYLQASIPNFSRTHKWKLLWNAEMIASAQAVWKTYESSMSRHPQEKRLLPEIVNMIHRQYIEKVNKDAGETDQLRLFFIKDVAKMQLLISWAFMGMHYLMKEDDSLKESTVLVYASDGYDLVRIGLSTGLSFRLANLRLYGLRDETFDPVNEGILASVQSFEHLPEIWTGTRGVAFYGAELVNNVTKLVQTLISNETELDSRSTEVVEKLANESASIVELVCKSYEEHCRWSSAETSKMPATYTKKRRAELEKLRHEMLVGLGSIDRADDGFAIAERFADMDALVLLLTQEYELCRDQEAQVEEGLRQQNNSGINEDEKLETRRKIHKIRAKISEKKEALDQRTQRYFEQFGQPWAHALFSDYVQQRELGSLLEKGLMPFAKAQLADFLHEKASRQKLGWIDNVLRRPDYLHTSQTLSTLADGEANSWCKHLELALAKISLASAEENGQEKASENRDSSARTRTNVQRDLTLLGIQDELHRHCEATIVQALDAESAPQLLVGTYGKTVSKGRRALASLLERGMDALQSKAAMDAEQLIDVLTLMDRVDSTSGTYDIAGREFFLALQALQNSGIDSSSKRFDVLLKVIWRRAFLADPWNEINNTDQKSDEDIQARLHDTILYTTFAEGLKGSLFSADPQIIMASPETVVGAGCSADDYSERFGNRDLQEPIASETAKEDNMLQKLIKKHRFEHWYNATKSAAEEDFKGGLLGQNNSDMAVNAAAIEMHQKELDATEPDELIASTNGDSSYT